MLGWALAALLVAAAWRAYGWQGVLFALTVIVFWLLLQFSRGVRAMRQASAAPVGRIGSAVMVNAKLKPGMTMVQVLQATGSLGRKQADTPAAPDAPDTWAWTDQGESTLTLVFERGRLRSWTLARPAEPPPAP